MWGHTRNSSGAWLGDFVSKVGYCPPLQAEAWGLLKSIQVAKYLGFKNIILEGDSTALVGAITDTSAARSPIHNIIKACREELRTMETWKVVAIPREINAVADHWPNQLDTTPKTFTICHNHH